MPNETFGTAEIPELPDKDQLIMVYCRSGRRSKEAPEKLVKYSRIKNQILHRSRLKKRDVRIMLTYTYISKGKFGLVEKPKPTIQHERDAIVKVTLASICSSDLHIKHGSVPRAVEGITVGHEMVGLVEEVGSAVPLVKPGDTVTV
ncbi:MAG: alcohol dehydrogenase catalytic domain-containing protein, partial [Clostridia bacterium]|nr:alcohol dehydrogenase catalytic domain-containing protein [Clostridia bacterium]